MAKIALTGHSAAVALVACACTLGISACSSSNSKSDNSNSKQTTDDDAGGSAAGSVKLADCDGRTESSAMPITEACGTFTSPTGTKIQLGPYGASMDVNVGKGFENPDPMDSPTCPGFAALFMEDQNQTNQLLDVGTQPCTDDTPNTGTCLNMTLYTVYRPATWPKGQIPVVTWGNGTCAQPEGYGSLLRYIASYGFFVVAANSREVGTGADLSKALDFITAANADSTSPYYGHLDLTKIAASGHSQGCAAAAAATQNDARIQNAILFNGSDSLNDSKPFLAISGDMDVTGFTVMKMQTDLNAAPGPGAFMYYHNPSGATADTIKGHLVLMLTPDRVTQQAVAWLQMEFNDDAKAKAQFVGSSCGFCDMSSDFDYGEKGL